TEALRERLSLEALAEGATGDLPSGLVSGAVLAGLAVAALVFADAPHPHVVGAHRGIGSSCSASQASRSARRMCRLPFGYLMVRGAFPIAFQRKKVDLGTCSSARTSARLSSSLRSPALVMRPYLSPPDLELPKVVRGRVGGLWPGRIAIGRGWR